MGDALCCRRREPATLFTAEATGKAERRERDQGRLLACRGIERTGRRVSGSPARSQPEDDETAGFLSLLKRSKTAGVSAIHAGGVESFLEKRNGTLLHLGYGEVGQERKKTGNKPPALTILSFNAAEAGQAAAPLVAAAPAASLSPAYTIQSITAGYEHSLALARDGNVWAWGNNDVQTAGPRPDSPNTVPGKNVPSRRSLFGAARSIACGEQFTVAVNEDGSIWMWGRRIPQYGGTAKQNIIRMPQLENVAFGFGGSSLFYGADEGRQGLRLGKDRRG